MCLSASTSRRPLFSTAYKVIIRLRNGKCTFPFFCFMSEFNPNDRKWLQDYSRDLIYYDKPFIRPYPRYHSGFHSYSNLTHAIILYESLSKFSTEQYEVWEIDTDEILEYGVEGQKDVVVSRKMKFVQRII